MNPKNSRPDWDEYFLQLSDLVASRATCDRGKSGCVRTTHAEQNALCQAARYGISVEGATLYCKMEPCRVCAMLIIGVGIKKVVCRKRYQAGQDTRDMFKEAGIELVVIENEEEKY